MSMVLDTRFHIWFIMTFYYKMRQILLQNATAIFLQNATEIYYKMRQDFYYKMWQFYYKMWHLLQFATILLQNATFITNCDSTLNILINYILIRHTIQIAKSYLLSFTAIVILNNLFDLSKSWHHQPLCNEKVINYKMYLWFLKVKWGLLIKSYQYYLE